MMVSEQPQVQKLHTRDTRVSHPACDATTSAAAAAAVTCALTKASHRRASKGLQLNRTVADATLVLQEGLELEET